MKRIYLMTIIIVSIIFILSGCFFNHPSQNKGNPETKSPPKSSSLQTLFNQIISAANRGEVPNVPFAAGKTEIADVEKAWGKPQSVNNTAVGIYAEFPDHSTVFGYYSQSPVFEIRSFDKSIQAITFNDVEGIMGKPDKVSYYNNKDLHQQIVVYQLNNGDELEWVMQKPDSQNTNPHIDHISVYNEQIAEHSISAEINKMTLDEKIGQMFMVGINGTTPGSDAKTMINQEHVGGIILYGENIKNPNQTVDFTNQLKTLNSNAHNPEPLFISVDEEGGEVDRMPSPIIKMPSNSTVGKVDDPDYSYRVGQILGKEINSLGFNMDYAPVLDVIAHPGKSAIGDRSFGSNANTVSQLGTSTMKGIQSQNVISVIKHFPGYGSVDIDAHKELPSIGYGLDKLENVDWLPYENAIKNGADVVMVTHLLVPALKTQYPASMSPVIITDMLRNKLGFKGVVITDDMTMGAIEKNYSIQTAAVKAVEAGADIVMIAFHEDQQEAAMAALKQAVKDGTISENRIDDSVYRILQLKKKYNLSNQSISYPNVKQLNNDIYSVIK